MLSTALADMVPGQNPSRSYTPSPAIKYGAMIDRNEVKYGFAHHYAKPSIAKRPAALLAGFKQGLRPHSRGLQPISEQ